MKRNKTYIDTHDQMRLESARGLVHLGLLPTIVEYNSAVATNKLSGRLINLPRDESTDNSK